MKICLLDALHARPASLLVRLASRYDAVVEIWKGSTRADAAKILDVLSLGAAKGDEIELRAEGDHAVQALEALAALIARNFDSDLVPEVGAGAVEGIGIGRAVVLPALETPTEQEERAKKRSERAEGATAGLSLGKNTAGGDEEARRVEAAVARVVDDLDRWIVALPPSEAALFEPEREIVRELGAKLLARVNAGEPAEDAVFACTESSASDLLVDARMRLMDALRGREDEGIARARAIAAEQAVIVIAEELTPSLVAALPANVCGIVAGQAVDTATIRGAPGGYTSHAAILARGRGIPLAYVQPHVAIAINDGDTVAVDTTRAPARVWATPSPALIAELRARAEARDSARDVSEEAARAPLSVPVTLLVNVGAVGERVPLGAEGIGLVRTELVFAGRTIAPSEAEQAAVLVALSRAARGGQVTARLFDAGGDKPLPWLAAPGDDDIRGMALLFAHPAVLATQLRAIVRAARSGANVRALLPMTQCAADVEAIRASAPDVPIGAMIETPEAVRDVEAIAAAADFVCIGTNDLTALTLGLDRAAATRALDPRVLSQIARVVEGSHAQGKTVTVCGEIAADPRGAPILVGLGVDALSVTPARIPDVRNILRDTTIDACRTSAKRAMGSETP